jgi:hypothetical protein
MSHEHTKRQSNPKMYPAPGQNVPPMSYPGAPRLPQMPVSGIPAAMLQNPQLMQAAAQMMQNPQMVQMLQDPRNIQMAMQMMQQQQRPRPVVPPQFPMVAPAFPAGVLTQQMAALSVREGTAETFLAKKPSTKTPKQLQQEAANRREKKREERRVKKKAEKKQKKKQLEEEEEEDNEDFDFSKSTKIYDMWNDMLVTMLDKVAEIRPSDALTVEMMRKVIKGFADDKNPDLRKEPLNAYYAHLLPHYALIETKDARLFDPKLNALGDLDKLSIDKHWPSLTLAQQEMLWTNIELLFLMAVQIKGAKSNMLKLIEIALADAQDSAESDEDADEPQSATDAITGILGKSGIPSGALAAMMGGSVPQINGPADVDAMVQSLPADAQAQVKSVIASMEKKPGDSSNDLFGMNSEGLLALLRTQTVVPKVAIVSPAPKK